MSSNLVHREYEGHAITYREDGWFNATQAAAKFGLEPTAWLRQADTVAYLAALCSRSGNSGFVTELNEIKGLDGKSNKARKELLDLAKRTGFVHTKAGAPENGGGTWLHPKLAVRFSQWLDVNFAVWCDEQIDGLLRGKVDKIKLRHEAASSYKVMSQILQMARADAGKDTAGHHYINEARLINSLLTGEFKGVDRDTLGAEDLALLAHLEERNAVLIGRGVGYAERKPVLTQYAMDWRAAHAPRLITAPQLRAVGTSKPASNDGKRRRQA